MSSGPWIDEADASPHDVFAGDTSCDTVVVGAGISGLSIARQLTEQGRDVVLLEAGRVGEGASGRNAGFLLADGARSYAHVAASRGETVARALRSLGHGTRTVVHDLGAQHPEIELEPCGSLRLAGDEQEAAEMRRTAERLGGAVRYLDGTALPEPWRRIGRFTGGLEDPGDALLHPLQLMQVLLARVLAGGGRVYERTRVASVHTDAGGVIVQAPEGRVHAEDAVLATNAWTRKLLPVALRPVRAQMLEAAVEPVPAWHQAMYANGGADYWRRRRDDRVLVGGRRLVGGEAEETDDAQPGAAVQGALDALLATLVGPDARTRIVRRWAGIMAFTPDGLPLAGRAPGEERLYILAGLNGQGMGWAPGLAVLLAEHMAGRTGVLPTCYAPERFGESPEGAMP